MIRWASRNCRNGPVAMRMDEGLLRKLFNSAPGPDSFSFTCRIRRESNENLRRRLDNKLPSQSSRFSEKQIHEKLLGIALTNTNVDCLEAFYKFQKHLSQQRYLIS